MGGGAAIGGMVAALVGGIVCDLRGLLSLVDFDVLLAGFIIMWL